MQTADLKNLSIQELDFLLSATLKAWDANQQGAHFALALADKIRDAQTHVMQMTLHASRVR